MSAAVRPRPREVDRDEYRACGRKIRHASKTAAQAQAKRFRRAGGEQLYPYPCARCGGWHTSKLRRAVAP